MDPIELTLILVRHGVPLADDRVPHKEWPLNDEGRAQARTLRARLSEKGLRPTLAVVSDAVRTQQTAQEIMGEGSAPFLVIPALSSLVPDEVAQTLQQIRDAVHSQGARHVLVVCHSNSLPELATAFFGRKAELVRYLMGADGFMQGLVIEWSAKFSPLQ